MQCSTWTRQSSKPWSLILLRDWAQHLNFTTGKKHRRRGESTENRSWEAYPDTPSWRSHFHGWHHRPNALLLLRHLCGGCC
ncbi:hypothetical protein ACFX13_029541 [Malus domestica]